MSFVLLILLLFALQFGLEYLFSLMGISPIVANALIDVVFAFVFAFVYYRGDKKEAFKDIRFHRSVAMYFLILVIFSFLWGLLSSGI